MRFYTYPDPPKGIKPRFALVSFHYINVLKRYTEWEHAIIDSGVEIFAKGAKDYPPGFMLRYEHKAVQWSQIYGDKVWFVIPDYPDGYRNNPIENNVEKTLKNIEHFSKIGGVKWVYPIQSDYMSLESFHYSCHQVQKYRPEIVAIGTVCKTRNVDFILKCCRMARNHFPNAWIHAFGPTLRALPKILPYIDSWDSCAFFTSRKSGERMAKTVQQRYEYYLNYLRRVDEILSQFKSQRRLDQYIKRTW